jgi:hypothetical protein
MPIDEIEKHPFLQLQENSQGFLHSAINIVIIGTFPIYSITSSIPLEKKGDELRDKWNGKANFQYFYGSKENHFWRILSSTFKKPFPKTSGEAINLLTENGIFISDVFKTVVRNDYSPLDKDLRIKEINTELTQKIGRFPNLHKIIFTSRLAKSTFCNIVGISNTGGVQNTQLYGNNIVLYSLPTPSGNGRSVSHYFNDFPPSKEELANKKVELPYAINYRMRLYNEILK